MFAGREGEVMLEWGQWLAGTGIFPTDDGSYAWSAVNSMNALTWWKAWLTDTLHSKVAQMLHNVSISAAPTERNSSLRSGIHTKLRNRMNVDTGSQRTFIKHNLLLEYAYLFRTAVSDQALGESDSDEQVDEEEEACENAENFKFF